MHPTADPALEARPDPRQAWPFGPLTPQQQREQQATEAALRAGRVRVFRAFDDTVAGGLE
jgi:hypothetical protein